MIESAGGESGHHLCENIIKNCYYAIRRWCILYCKNLCIFDTENVQKKYSNLKC